MQQNEMEEKKIKETEKKKRGCPKGRKACMMPYINEIQLLYYKKP